MRSPVPVLLVLTMVLHLGAATAAEAQMTSDQTALLQYTAERKNEWVAVGLEWLVPIVGHAYAGNAKRGILPTAVTVGGLAMAIAGARCDSMCAVGGKPANNEGLGLAGLGVAMVGRTWALVSAHRTAAAHNAGLRDRLGISITGRAGRPEARISLRI
jgi:hypothetical protein